MTDNLMDTNIVFMGGLKRVSPAYKKTTKSGPAPMYFKDKKYITLQIYLFELTTKVLIKCIALLFDIKVVIMT